MNQNRNCNIAIANAVNRISYEIIAKLQKYLITTSAKINKNRSWKQLIS